MTDAAAKIHTAAATESRTVKSFLFLDIVGEVFLIFRCKGTDFFTKTKTKTKKNFLRKRKRKGRRRDGGQLKRRYCRLFIADEVYRGMVLL